MRVQVRAFARLRELLGGDELVLDLEAGSSVSDAWNALAAGTPALRDLARSTRIARNAKLAAPDEALADGDRLALLPPVGGG